jgi:hypothetical protein
MGISFFMRNASRISWAKKLSFLGILLAQIIVLWVSPEERTLGVGIKPVYLHVSFTWVGMFLLYLTGLVGVVVLISGHDRSTLWLKRTLTLGVVFFTVGFFISLFASLVNWGGVPFREPKVISALNILVVSGVIWILSRWVTQNRIIGFLSFIPPVFMVFREEGSRMVLHPDNPVNTSPDAIKFSFYAMFFLAVLLAIWFSINMGKK